MGKLVFLDFDGVLRRITSNPSRFDQDCLDSFESAMRQSPTSKIVITSTWRLVMSLAELRSRFSSDIATRIVGVTPENEEEESYERYVEIQQFMREKRVTALPWVAIDDDREHFPAGSPVIFTDPVCGFDVDCKVRLIEFFQA